MAATLDDVVKAIREGNEGTATQQAKAAEQANEQKVYDNQVLATLSSISDAIKGITPFKIQETDSKGFLGKILTSFGLIGAGAAGLAAGLAAGWAVYVADLTKDIVKTLKTLLTTTIKGFGKALNKFLDLIPRPQFVDDIIDAFKADGKVGQFFTKIKNFFVGETGFVKRIGLIVDDVIDTLKGVTGGMFTRIKNFFVGETGFVKRIGAVVDGVIDSLKGFTGGIFTKIKNFFVGETSVFKRIGVIVDTAVDGVKGFTGGLFTKIVNFFTGETSVFKRIGKIADTTIETLKAFTGGAFDKIAAPFKWLKTNTTTGSIIGDAIDAIMGIFKTGAGEGGFMTKVFDGIKSVFTSLKNIGSVLTAPFDAIKGVFGTVTEKGGGILDTIMKFINPFKGVFQTFARIGSKLAAPLSIIMGLFDAGFETKDAVEKSEGVFATLLNGLIGAMGGFIDGAVIQVADFLKDGIATVLGFFGFEETEKAMKDISFSKSFNEMLDKVYAFVNDLFDIDFDALAKSIMPESIYNFLFGDKAEQIADLEAKIKEARESGPEENLFSADETQEEFNKRIAGLTAELEKLKGVKEFKTGGLVTGSGLAMLHGSQSAPELVLDNQATEVFLKAANLLTNSQALERMRGGSPVVINNVNNSQNNPVISNQATTMKVPDAVRSGEPSFGMAARAMMN